MKSSEFVEKMSSQSSQEAFPALRETICGLAKDADSLPVIIGGGKVQYSRHLDKNIRKSSDHFLISCHKDTIQHTDNC